MKCNEDCFNCPFPDCRLNKLTLKSWQESTQLDRELREKDEPKVKRKQRAYIRACYKANPDKFRERFRQFYAKHAQEERDRLKRYYLTHREERIAYAKIYRDTHKEELADRYARWYADNRERKRQYDRERYKKRALSVAAEQKEAFTCES